MKYQDELKISEMEEGKRYPITQGNNGYSNGVWMTKHEDAMEIRHFWTKDILEYDKDVPYYFDEEDGVCYPTDPNDDYFDFIHKDIMQVIPDAISYFFEDMTLSEFYEIVEMGIQENYWDKSYVFPKHLKGKMKTLSRDKKVINNS